ncbi:MAG: virulence protein RhuM/Fic/DOC family protein [Candidatus Gottesmanbacteria bacterium]
MKTKNNLVIYQATNGAVEVRIDSSKETIYLTQQQVGQLFNVQKAAISKHVNNIFNTGELDKKSTVSILETVQSEGKRKITRKIEYYNLDLILSIGYRVNSTNATKFRQWATKTLREHIVKGYTINKKQITKNYDSFMHAVDNVRALLPESMKDTGTIVSLIQAFADTWVSLQAYDKGTFYKGRVTKKKVSLATTDVITSIAMLKQALMQKGEATDLFAIEKDRGSIEGILGNVLQSFDDQDVYPSIEEKSAHLLYFVVKNHPFIDGNKRTGAFVFVWFLQEMGKLNSKRLTPDALTAITLLIAESDPKDKDKMTSLVTMLLGRV